eukprot:Partr_v1_DN24966_c0_g1_i2_m45362 putative Zinc finger with UFM1-specific peptidase domain
MNKMEIRCPTCRDYVDAQVLDSHLSSNHNQPPPPPPSITDDDVILILSDGAGHVDDLQGDVARLRASIDTLSSLSLGNSLLARPTTRHFGIGREDRGWGCGYRNIQMLLSSLVYPSSYSLAIPSTIHDIQGAIESAWARGFDPMGAGHFSGRLRGTKAWLGATEVATLLYSMRIPCTIVDFARRKNEGCGAAVVQYVKGYFAKGRPDVLPCMYLQYQGHSMTVVGVQQGQGAAVDELWIFDPSVVDLVKTLERSKKCDRELKRFRVDYRWLDRNSREYQLVHVDVDTMGMFQLETVEQYNYRKSGAYHLVKC